MRRIALVALLVLALVPSAAAQADEPIRLKLLIDSGHAGVKTSFMAFDTTKRTLFDLDGDGVVEIIAQNDNGKTYVLRGSDGTALAELSTVHPIGWAARDLNDVAVGDVNGNGRIDLVIANSVGYVTVYELKKDQPERDRFAFERLWQKQLNPREINPNVESERPWYDWSQTFAGMDGGVYLADVDGNGKLEIFAQTDNQPGFFALNHDGSLRWGVDWSDGNANPWVDDLDGDGRLEAVFVTDGGSVYVFDASSGSAKGAFHAKQAPGGCAAAPGAISVSPAVVDLDGDGRKEIVFGARQANGTEDEAKSGDWRAAQDTRIYAVGSDGEMRWCFTAPWLAPHLYMHPASVDANGDGKRDVILVDWNTIGHKPGGWETVNPPHVFALNHAGQLLWKRALSVGWSNKDVAVADVDGDGKQEVLVADERGGSEGFSVLSVADGKYERFVAAPDGWGVSRGPQVADLDDDGKLEVVVPVWRGASGCSTSFDVGCREGAIAVYGTNGERAASPGVFHFNHQYETEYDGKSPKKAAPPEKTDVQHSATLRGRVVDDDGPVRNADIRIQTPEGSASTTTDDDGRFILRVPAGTWDAFVDALGHREFRGNVTLLGARLTEWEIVLEESAVGKLLPNFLPGAGAGLLVAAAAGVAILRRVSEKR